MGLRIRKSIKLSKNTRLNISKSGLSVSTGIRGARVSVNNKGTVRTSAGIPSTGIYYTKQQKLKGAPPAVPTRAVEAAKKKLFNKCMFWTAVIIIPTAFILPVLIIPEVIVGTIIYGGTLNYLNKRK